MGKNEVLRNIPAIDRLSICAANRVEFAGLSHSALIDVLQQAVRSVRADIIKKDDGIMQDEEGVREEILFRAIIESKKLLQPKLRKVVNATGIVLHTNLGRAPLGERARRQVNEVMEGYSTLEYDLDTGKRGDRYQHVAQRIAAVCGAEAALVVNNNAAAVMLVLAAFARGREVIVSRGELVEIGGSFRIPDVMKQSGATLVEVGSTNKTHIDDYSGAITMNTAAILKVHTSNYRIVGFTSEPSMTALCDLAHSKGIMAINDLGSGTLTPFSRNGYREPSVGECIDASFDLVSFSGDKLLGAGQAGIIAGKKIYVEMLRKEPLLRAFRIDKLSLAALEGTLIDYAIGSADKTVPAWIMLNMSQNELKRKADSMAEKLASLIEAGWHVRVVKTQSLAGGGSLPAVELPGYGVEITPAGMTVAKAEEALRRGDLPVIGLIRDNALLLDVRCMLSGDEELVCKKLIELVRENQE